MQKIHLNNDVFTVVDDEDYEKFKDYPWRYNKATGYVFKTRYAGRHKGKPIRPTEYLHRFILDVTDRNTDVDHINGDKLDNRRQNIRPVTRSQNQKNHKIHRNGRPVGVTYYTQGKREFIRSLIYFSGTKKRYFLGHWPNEEMASKAYQLAAELLNAGCEPTKVRLEVRRTLTPPLTSL